MNVGIYILAGGNSTRMKQDKATMLFKGKPMLQYVIDVAKQISNEIYILTNHKAHQSFHLPCIPDEVKHTGAAGGIDAMLQHTTHEINVLLSCDMPFVDETSIRTLLLEAHKASVVVPTLNGFAEPLLGVYSKTIKNSWRQELQKENYKLSTILATLNVLYYSGEALQKLNPDLFRNINSKEDII
jgi:molybdenum cofactor guanylyltransferase